MKILMLFFVCMNALFALSEHRLEPESVKDGSFEKIKILDSKVISLSKVDDEPFYGISGIVYDENRDMITMLSDKGRLFKFKMSVSKGKIMTLEPISGHRLENESGKKLFRDKSDSEGLTLMHDGDTKALLVSFEGAPRVLKFDLSGRGMVQGDTLELPKKLQSIANYQGRNNALEALTYHAKYGFLTAGEFPLRGEKNGFHAIYNHDGVVCAFDRGGVKNAVTGFETMKDGNLLVLERNFNPKNFQLNITLKKVYLDAVKKGICRSETLALMESAKGWDLDNFEGIAHYKDNIYLMISDDNDNFFQKTILTMFEIKGQK